MTREEASKVIKDGLEDMSLDYIDIEQYEALTMAIKALEQEPNGDAISRQAVLDGIDTYIYKAQSTGTQDDFYSFAELVVKALPSVKQEPKTGHWLKENPFLLAECSECGNKAFGNHGFDEVLTEYCPHCGAKMESEGKE